MTRYACCEHCADDYGLCCDDEEHYTPCGRSGCTEGRRPIE